MSSVLSKIGRNKLLEMTLSVIKGYTDAEVERRTGLRAATIARWRSGDTRNPTSLSLTFVLSKYGYEVSITKVREISHLSLIKKAA